MSRLNISRIFRFSNGSCPSCQYPIDIQVRSAYTSPVKKRCFINSFACSLLFILKGASKGGPGWGWGKRLGKEGVHFQMKRPGAETLLLTGGILMTAFLLWFAVNSQISARPVARAILQGLALSLRQAIENLAARDPSFKALSDFRYRDIAYFALIDRSGRVRFHQNPELVGELIEDNSTFAGAKIV
jgi:hypothetical protein